MAPATGEIAAHFNDVHGAEFPGARSATVRLVREHGDDVRLLDVCGPVQVRMLGDGLHPDADGQCTWPHPSLPPSETDWPGHG